MASLDAFTDELETILDPAESLRRLRCIMPVRHLRPRPHQPWNHQLHRVALQSVPMVATTMPPMTAQVEADDRDRLTAIHVARGSLHLRQQRSTWTAGPGSYALLSAAPYAVRTNGVSCIIMIFSKEQLLLTGTRLLGAEKPHRQWQPLLDNSDGQTLSRRALAADLDFGLEHGLALLAVLSRCQPWLPDRCGFDALIHQLLALMLFPELRRDLPMERIASRRNEGRDAFDDLLDTINAHLHEPLSLDWLVQTSHYSPRTLQYKFRQRLGCTATHWIRNQRLELALRRLQHPGPTDTVATIARSCGYRSVNQFGADFQQRFAVRPSQLLREARRQRPDSSRG
ncbi:MAG: helix-turn-helix transcriptional regulator [Cyanobacteriota bacterium]|jgi:AraC-like DNA-binding protein